MHIYTQKKVMQDSQVISTGGLQADNYHAFG